MLYQRCATEFADAVDAKIQVAREHDGPTRPFALRADAPWLQGHEILGFALNESSSNRLERIDQRHAERFEIGRVARDHRQAVHLGHGGDHGVFDQGV